jgi:hypothetical protein
MSEGEEKYAYLIATYVYSDCSGRQVQSVIKNGSYICLLVLLTRRMNVSSARYKTY